MVQSIAQPRLSRPLIPVGEFFAFAADVLMAMFQRPFQWREFFDQAWFVTRVSLLPICAITDWRSRSRAGRGRLRADR